MASTVLPNGIIIPEKYSRDWYADLYHNWQELDNLLGGGTPKDGTLTIQKNGDTVGTFSANQATNETINITVPDVNNGTLTIQQNGTTVDTFTANSSSDKTVNITVPTKTSDLTNDSEFITEDDTKIPLSGTNALAGSIVPNTDNTYDFGSLSYKLRYIYCGTAYVTNLNVNGKTIATDANNNMIFDSHIVDTIEEQGNGYIRYSNGLQICYGSVVNNNNLATGIARYSFPKVFISVDSLVVTSNLDGKWIMTGKIESNATWILQSFAAWFSPMDYNDNLATACYVAIGRWK